jgi:hypothetical protein
MEIGLVSETLSSSECWTMHNVQNPLISSVLHHRQNPLESTYITELIIWYAERNLTDIWKETAVQ